MKKSKGRMVNGVNIDPVNTGEGSCMFNEIKMQDVKQKDLVLVTMKTGTSMVYLSDRDGALILRKPHGISDILAEMIKNHGEVAVKRPNPDSIKAMYFLGVDNSSPEFMWDLMNLDRDELSEEEGRKRKGDNLIERWIDDAEDDL